MSLLALQHLVHIMMELRMHTVVHNLLKSHYGQSRHPDSWQPAAVVSDKLVVTFLVESAYHSFAATLSTAAEAAATVDLLALVKFISCITDGWHFRKGLMALCC